MLMLSTPRIDNGPFGHSNYFPNGLHINQLTNRQRIAWKNAGLIIAIDSNQCKIGRTNSISQDGVRQCGVAIAKSDVAGVSYPMTASDLSRPSYEGKMHELFTMCSLPFQIP